MPARWRCPRCASEAAEPPLLCVVCGFEVDGGVVLDATQTRDEAGKTTGHSSDGHAPNRQRGGEYNPEQVAIEKRKYCRGVLREVAAALHMDAHHEVMWGYFERAVGGEFGEGQWVRVWSAAVAHIVARTRPTPVGRPIGEIAATLGVKLRQLYGQYRTVVGLLRLRHVLEAAGVSEGATKRLLEDVDVHNGEIFSLKARHLEKLGIPLADIPRVLDASVDDSSCGGGGAAAVAAGSSSGSTRYPLPDDGTDPRVLIDRFIRILVPQSWFRDQPVKGNSTVVELTRASFWLLTLALTASLGTGRKAEPLAAAAVILAAESARLRAPGQKLVLAMAPIADMERGQGQRRSSAAAPSQSQSAESLMDTSDVASKLGVAHPTLRKRYGELRNCALVRAKSLPWGESVTDEMLNDYLGMLINAEESRSQRETKCVDRHRNAGAGAPAAATTGDTTAVDAADARAGSGLGSGSTGAGPTIDGAGFVRGNGEVRTAAPGYDRLADSMLPPAFVANKKLREHLTERVHTAQSRLRNTLAAAAHPALPPDDGSDQTRGTKRHCLDSFDSDSAVAGAAVRSNAAVGHGMRLDAEDLVIERQLLAGVSAADVIAGSTKGRHATAGPQLDGQQQQQQQQQQQRQTSSSAATPLGEASTDLADEQLQPGGQFLRTPAEVAVMRRFIG